MKYELDELELCRDLNCDHGKALSPDGDSAVVDCPICKGRGFKPKDGTKKS